MLIRVFAFVYVMFIFVCVLFANLQTGSQTDSQTSLQTDLQTFISVFGLLINLCQKFYVLQILMIYLHPAYKRAGF